MSKTTNDYALAAETTGNPVIIAVEHHDLTQNIDGYDIPIDPMEDLQCDSCQ
jgi:hypothetical protein